MRLVANRDEQRSRPPALPPRAVICGGTQAIMPIDPVSSGTWVAANEHGLVIALLNVNRGAPPAPPRSRGEIVPALIALRSLEEVERAAATIDREQFAPFRLICATTREAIEVAASAASVRRFPLDSPVMLTSSGLGDHHVDTPRRALFNALVERSAAADASLATAQDRFHAHRWAAAPQLSVLMEREDAATVSRTTVEVSEERVTVMYAAPPAWRPTIASLPRQRPASSR